MTATTLSRKIQRSAHPAPHRGLLWGFDYRHPFEALWKLFGSVRLAIVLISTLVGLSIVGVIVAQASAEIVASPQDYAAWVATSAHQQYGNFTDLMNWLQLFIIFRSWYFKVLIVLLALNTFVGGMLNRAPKIWREFRHPQLRRADGFYANSPVRAGVTASQFGGTTPATVTGLRAIFQRRGFRVTEAPGSNEQVSYLYVQRQSWASLSTFVFHTCLILTMFSAVLTGWGGFGVNSNAQRVLPGPIYQYFQNLGGFSYVQPLPNGEGGVVYPLGTDHNIRYRAEDFVATYDPRRGTPTDFYTDLQVFQDGRMVAQKRIRVNDPLTYQGVTFHQASFMMYTQVTLRDNQGSVLFSGAVPLLNQQTSQPDPNSGNVLQTNNAQDVPISTYGYTMNLAAAALDTGHWYLGVGGFDAQQRPLFKGVALVTPNQAQRVVGCINSDANATPTDPGTYGCQLSNGWWLQVNDLRRGTVLLITKDSGTPLLWPSLTLLILSVSITFLFPMRRIWARVEGDQVRMAALQEHKVNMQRDLDDAVRALGNRPLRPDPPPEATGKGHESMKNDKHTANRKARSQEKSLVLEHT